jgi:hypothetical protein
MKSRKYRKSRKNCKRVKRGGESDLNPREAISYNGPIDITQDTEYKRFDRMVNFDKNSKNAQEKKLQIGMQKDRLSQLTDLNAFQRLDPDQQKALVKTFMSLTPVEQDEYIKNFKYLNGGKTKKRRRKNKKIRGGEKGECTERALDTELISNPKEYYGQLKNQYCTIKLC